MVRAGCRGALGPDGRRRRSQRGAALLLVVVSVTVLAILLGVVVDRVGREIAGTRRFMGELQLRELVRGGVRLALDRLAADETPGFDGREEEWLRALVVRREGYELKVTVTDEGSRINLNSAPAEVLAALPGVGPEELDGLLLLREGWLEVPEEVRSLDGWGGLFPRVRDWVTVFGPVNLLGMASEQIEPFLAAREVDRTVGQIVAEEVLAARRTVRDELPDSLEELARLLPSLTPGVLDRLREDLSPEGPLNVNLAAPEVLSALWTGLGLKDESRRRLLEVRAVADFTDAAALWTALGDPEAAKTLRPYLGVASRIFRIRVEARPVKADGRAEPAGDRGSREAAEAIVRRNWDGQQAKFSVLSWSEVE